MTPIACGDDAGTGGAGAAGTTTATSAATTKAGVSVTQTNASAMPICDGSFWGPTCGACLEAECCAELEQSNGVWSEDIDSCADACAADCFNEFEAPECSVPVPLPATGACVAADVHDCNPITQEGCNVAAGEACDLGAGKFVCYPAPNTLAACETCPQDNDSTWCGPGLTCTGTCAKYCCEDADCGPGTCVKGLYFIDLGVGLCETDGMNEGGGGGGVGGSGGQGGGAAGGGGAGGN
jgi:uncharacterized membrane protein YgcG